MNVFAKQRKTKPLTSADVLDIFTALVTLFILTPIFFVNASIALLKNKAIAKETVIQDAVGRPLYFYQWSFGGFKNSLMLLNILSGDLALCGVSIRRVCLNDSIATLTQLKPGLFSVYEVHQTIGYIEMNHGESIRHHEKNNTAGFNLSLMAKALLCRLIYGNKNGKNLKCFNLFGIRIENVTLNDVVKQIFHRTQHSCQSIFFVNVNSVNIGFTHKRFRETLNQADLVLADGSGVRLGAKRMGFQLQENINGTDLLPHICENAQHTGQSLFLLGSKPGVAEEASRKLQQQYPRLVIAGTHHGYFDTSASDDIIEKINHSKADICLVAMGSPVQEQWVENNKQRLQTHTALAVGGLFDFYSGNIRRAPRWMREIGMEWLYRLAMEPKAKFRRYVLGNPLYIFRLLAH